MGWFSENYECLILVPLYCWKIPWISIFNDFAEKYLTWYSGFLENILNLSFGSPDPKIFNFLTVEFLENALGRSFGSPAPKIFDSS